MGAVAREPWWEVFGRGRLEPPCSLAISCTGRQPYPFDDARPPCRGDPGAVPAILAALAAAVVMGRLRDQNRRLSTTQNDHMAEQARVEAELRQSQERSAAIVETMVNGIALLDMDGRITFANRMHHGPVPGGDLRQVQQRRVEPHLVGRRARRALWHR
jgi:PAS domain-containing protein